MNMLAQAAQTTATASAIAKDATDKPNWTDVAGFWVALGAGLITFFAVLVALYGPRYQAWRRRPQLSLTVDPTSDDVVPINSSETDNVYPIRVLISNKRGRDTAKDVELFVTITNDLEEREARGFRERITGSLVFDSPWSTDARAISSVPSGFARPVWFALIGPSAAVAGVVEVDLDAFRMAARHCEVDEGATAGITIQSAVAGHEEAWLLAGSQYDVEFVITGSNIDAIRYTVRLRFDFEDTALSRYFTLKWLRGPVLDPGL